jgi:hypothetical protein
MKTIEVKQLKQQVEEKYKQTILLAEQERIKALTAIDTVYSMLHKPRGKRNIKVDIKPELTDALKSTKEAQVVTTKTYGALKAVIQKALEIVPPTFTIQDVYRVIEQISPTVAVTCKRSSISGRLARLTKEGTIEEVKRGSGSSPTIYRVKTNEKLFDKKLEQ